MHVWKKSIVSSSKISPLPSRSVYPRGTRGERFNRHIYLSIGKNRWSAVRRAGKREKDLPALFRKLKGVPRRGRPAARQSSSLISRHSRFFHFYRCKHRLKGVRFENYLFTRDRVEIPFPESIGRRTLIPRLEPATGGTNTNHSGGGAAAFNHLRGLEKFLEGGLEDVEDVGSVPWWISTWRD